MRLWHYEIIKYLPNSQLLAQWRELNSIYKNQPNHILINYVYCYPKEYLKSYSDIVMREMVDRGYNIKSLDAYNSYFEGVSSNNEHFMEHNNRYLLQNFCNLEEKYDRGQEDFSPLLYSKLQQFIGQKFGYISRYFMEQHYSHSLVDKNNVQCYTFLVWRCYI